MVNQALKLKGKRKIEEFYTIGSEVILNVAEKYLKKSPSPIPPPSEGRVRVGGQRARTE